MLPRGLGWLKPPQIGQGMCRQQALPRLESSCEGSRVLEKALGRAGDWGEAAWPRVAPRVGVRAGGSAPSSPLLLPPPAQEQLQPRQVRKGRGQRGPGVAFGEER